MHMVFLCHMHKTIGLKPWFCEHDFVLLFRTCYLNMKRQKFKAYNNTHSGESILFYSRGATFKSRLHPSLYVLNPTSPHVIYLFI